MSLEKDLNSRSNLICELCGANENLTIYEVPPSKNKNSYECILICPVCQDQIAHSEKMETNHWHCLNDTMWSQVPAVQVVAWRMLNRFKNEDWARNLLDIFYLDDEMLTWAKATGEDEDTEGIQKHTDCNGAELQSGDTVVLTKDLNVKGSSLIAKRGTSVRNISLVANNHEQIEGRVNGQMLVLLTKFVKKA